MRVFFLTCAVLSWAGCSRSGTGVLIDLLGSGSVDQIDVRGTWNGAVHGPDRSTARSPIALPTSILVMLPDVGLTASFDIDASLGGVEMGEGSTGNVAVLPHAIARANVTLAPPGSDLSTLSDLSSDDGPLPDLTTAPLPDLTGADMAGADLTPLPDLTAPRDLTPLPDLACTAGARCPYAYRRRITITNGGGTTLPLGFTVRIPLPTLTGKVRNDFNDLRVFTDVPNQERDRIVDAAPPGQSPAAWISLGATIAPAVGDNNYWLYYGDPNAAAGPQNGANVFLFYDDFPGTTLNAHWVGNGSPSVAGGLLTLHQNAADAVRSDYVNDKVPVQSVFEIRASVSNSSSGGQSTANGTFWWWAGYQRQNDFTESDPWVIWIQRGADTIQPERLVAGGNCASVCTPVNPFALDNAFHWYRIDRSSVSTAWFLDGVQKYTIADANSTDYSVIIRNYATASTLTVDWIRVRALGNPDPNVTVGAEEVLH
jgi:Domain of unknown function (DUF2341)